jgi:hypothetical protein
LILLALRVGIELTRNSLSFRNFSLFDPQHYPHYYPHEPCAAVTSHGQGWSQASIPWARVRRTSTNADLLEADILDRVEGISAPYGARPRSPVSCATRSRCVLHPTTDSHEPFAESAPAAETESAGDPVSISAARTTSTLVGASAAVSPGAPRLAHSASQRIVTGPSAQCA